MLLHLLPQTSPWDGIWDLQTGTTSWSLFEFLAVDNAEPRYVQKTLFFDFSWDFGQAAV